MTHVIGKPKPPKRGVMFASVGGGAYFERHADSREYRCYWRTDGNLAYRTSDGEPVQIDPDEAVTLLTVQPIDPKPDPDVCTYGELEPGAKGCFTEPCWSGVLMPVQCGPNEVQAVDLETGELVDCSSEPVRRTPVSVVVHEEPGTHVWSDDACPSRVSIVEPPANHRSYSRTEAAKIAQQLIAWLAAAEREGQSEPERSQGGSLLDAVKEVGGALKRAQGDRRKPAPGWELHQHLPGWWSTCRGGYVCGPRHSSKSAAIAYTHTDEAQEDFYAQQGREVSRAQHDAQQAGEGGGE